MNDSCMSKPMQTIRDTANSCNVFDTRYFAVFLAHIQAWTKHFAMFESLHIDIACTLRIGAVTLNAMNSRG